MWGITVFSFVSLLASRNKVCNEIHLFSALLVQNVQIAENCHFNVCFLGSMFQVIRVIWNNFFYLCREFAR